MACRTVRDKEPGLPEMALLSSLRALLFSVSRARPLTPEQWQPGLGGLLPSLSQTPGETKGQTEKCANSSSKTTGRACVLPTLCLVLSPSLVSKSPTRGRKFLCSAPYPRLISSQSPMPETHRSPAFSISLSPHTIYHQCLLPQLLGTLSSPSLCYFPAQRLQSPPN